MFNTLLALQLGNFGSALQILKILSPIADRKNWLSRKSFLLVYILLDWLDSKNEWDIFCIILMKIKVGMKKFKFQYINALRSYVNNILQFKF